MILLALPWEAKEIRYYNGLDKSLGKTTPIDLQSVLESRPKPFLNPPTKFPRWYRKPLALAGVMAALTLGGCTSDWTPRITDDASLSFIHRVGCIMGGNYDEYPDNLVYHVVKLESVSADVFDITAVTEQGDRRLLRRHVIARETLKTNVTNGFKFGAQFECVKLTSIPWSHQISKPFYVADEPAKLVGRNWLVFRLHLITLAGLALFLIIGTGLCVADPRSDRTTPLEFTIGSGGVVLAAVAILSFVCGLFPWLAAKQAAEYYAFYDALPRSEQGILPITIGQLKYLLAGPPHPNSIEASISFFAWATGALGATWLAANGSSIAAGVYSLCIQPPTTFDRFCKPHIPQSERSSAMSEQHTTYAPSPLTANRATPVFDIEGRLSEASNVRSHWHAWRLETEVAAAVVAMAAEAKHARAVVACLDEHTQAMAAMNRFFDAALEMQVRRDLANENYESQATGERDRFLEAGHIRALEGKRRDKEQLLADRESLSAKHGLQAERVFKRERFALGQKRIESRIAEAHVGVAVARNAAGRARARCTRKTSRRKQHS